MRDSVLFSPELATQLFQYCLLKDLFFPTGLKGHLYPIKIFHKHLCLFLGSFVLNWSACLFTGYSPAESINYCSLDSAFEYLLGFVSSHFFSFSENFWLF